MRRSPLRAAFAAVLTLIAVAVPVALFAVVPNNLGLLSHVPGVFFSAVEINVSAGDQFDAHVDGDIASYTDIASGIRYYNFATGDHQQVPSVLDDSDQLSGISDGRIVFSRTEGTGRQPIMVYDTASASTIEVDPQDSPLRHNPAIGANTVAFIDNGFLGGELFASVLGGATVRVTNDSRFDLQPSVAPGGDLIVYQSCTSDPSNCDIHQASHVASTWVVAALTNNVEPEADPDTDGVFIVYDALRSGEQDIFWRPVGGAEQRIELEGIQRNPSVASGLIAFESIANGEANAEVMIYHVPTNRLFGITFSPSENESLSNVTALPNDQFRLVYSRGSATAGGRDVYGVTFELPDVDSFEFGGFLQPVDSYPTLNSMKAGAAVAVKFSLGGDRGLDIFAAGYPQSQPLGCSPAEDPIEQTVTAGGSSLQYDATSDIYTYIWKTERSWAGTCRQLVIQFSDFSSPNYATFKFK